MCRVAIFSVFMGLYSACPGPTPNPPVDRCSGVRCTGDDLCNALTGRCESRDAGVVDAGVDAGLPDAGEADAGGEDAGLPDAGPFDAGTPDAGTPDSGIPDAGAPDAGEVDAGCSTNDECFLGAAPYCDPSTRACVECFADSHCPSSVVPVCDLRVSRCVGCVAGANCANPLPVCDATQQCVQCNTNADCGAGRECSALNGECTALNDTCASARAILPAGTGGISITAEPGQAIDDTAGTCNASGPELVYSFTTTVTQALTVAVAPLTGSSARPVVYLRGACTGTELSCDAPTSGSASLAVPALPPGTYFLFVESANGAPGRVSLNVSLQAPPTSAANSTCANAESLSANGTTVFRSVTVGNTAVGQNLDATLPTCSASARTNGNELWYRLTLSAPSNVTLIARPISGSTLRPVVSLASACGGTSSGCQAAPSATASTLSLPGLAAGTWLVQVDSADGTSGAFQLEVDATPIVGNDSCASATALSFTNDTATATGETTWAVNEVVSGAQTPSCSDSARGTGRDVVFSYSITTPRDVTVRVTPTGSNPTFQPVVSVRTACADATRAAEQGCASPVASTPAQLTLVNQPAGTYFVWVDASQDTSGPFQLEVVTAAPTPPPTNDSCSAPQVLNFVADVATAVGSTLQAANDNSGGDVSPTCNASAKQSGRDVVYSFSLSQPRDVRVQVTPTSGSTLIPAVYLRRGNCTSQLLSDEVVCAAAIGGVDTSVTRLAAGTYFLWVDSSAGTRGDFTLTVTSSAPTPAPANDACAGAQSLVFTNDVANVAGTLIGADNSNSPTDNAPACGTDFMPRRFGRDVVYAYTLTQAQDVDVTVTPDGSAAWLPTLYVRAPNQCASFSAGFELACVADTASRPLRIYLPNQPPGTYFLHVDSNSYASSPFSLRVARRPATLPPSNDRCQAPVALSHGTPVMGDTTAALDDLSSLTYPQACRRGLLDGRDVVYAYTATATGNVTAVVTPEAGFNPTLLLLQGGCSAAQCVRLADGQGAGVPESFSFPVTAGSTYYLVVDSVSREVPNAFGRFSLVVQ